MSNIEKIQINGENIRNNHLYLSGVIGFFPRDVVGGSNKDKLASKLLKITLPFGEEVMTDTACDKKYSVSALGSVSFINTGMQSLATMSYLNGLRHIISKLTWRVRSR